MTESAGVPGVALKNKVRAQQLIQGLVDGKTYTQIATDIGVTRQVLYALMKKEDVQQLMIREINELETVLQEWIREDRKSPNPTLRKAATQELGKHVRHVQDKVYPSIFRTETVNVNVNVDLTRLQRYEQRVTETLNRMPPSMRTIFWEKYSEVEEEQRQ